MSTINTSTVITSSTVGSYSWPVTITGNGTVVTIGTNLVFSNANQYFQQNGENIVIDGSGHTIDISGVTNYGGCISTLNFNIMTVKDLGITASNGSTLNNNAGWIIRTQCPNTIVINCYSTGPMSNINTGGIFGKDCDNCTAIECYSTGIISGENAGGIFGFINSNWNSSLTATCVQCYSTGAISGTNAGGIYGLVQLGGTYIATNCYSRGNVTGSNAGGIVGLHGDYPLCIITNCYSLGSVTGSNAGGILGLLYNNSERSTPVHCYAANGTWSNTTANANLTGVGTTVWNTTTTPYTLLPVTRINTSTVITSSTIGSYNWPIIVNGSGTIITIGTDLVFPDTTHHFIINSGSNIVIDGSGHTIDISINNDGVTTFYGCVQNSTGVSLTVKNLGITASNGSTIVENAGWLIKYNSQNVSVNNCYSTGPISNPQTGGIFGARCNNSSASGCYSTGIISGTNAGGIFGARCNNSSASGCYSTGIISGTNAGGIFGARCNNSSASGCYSTGIISGTSAAGGIFGYNCYNSSASGCYSTGIISGRNEGGIFGQDCYNSYASGCYSTGIISGRNAGGIFGSINSNWNSYTSTATSCYSTGAISGTNAGGIYGIVQVGGTYIATNCYSRGNVTGSNAGGIIGLHSDYPTCVVTNCYSAGTLVNSNYGILGLLYNNSEITTPVHCYAANGSWSNTTANANLTGVGTTVWNNKRTPYTLLYFDPNTTTNTISSPYTQFNQSSINNAYSWPVALSNDPSHNYVFDFISNVNFNRSQYFIRNGQLVTLVASSIPVTIANSDTVVCSPFQ